jgi:hypothetical protein
MDEQAKQMALQHIEEGEYKQAFAILDDFREDMEAKKIRGELDKISRQKRTLHVAMGMGKDKSGQLDASPSEYKDQTWWPLKNRLFTIGLCSVIWFLTILFVTPNILIFCFTIIFVDFVWVKIFKINREYYLIILLVLAIVVVVLAIIGPLIGETFSTSTLH